MSRESVLVSGSDESSVCGACQLSPPYRRLAPPPRSRTGGEAIAIATIGIATATTLEPAEPSQDDAWAWLESYGLLTGTEDQATILRRHKALSRCKFGEGVTRSAKRRFLQKLMPCEDHLAAKQTDIGNVADPKYQYELRLRNAVPIRAKPMRLRP